MSEPHAEREHPVAPLELFFDLVFVFGLTQVTALLSDDPTWSGVGHAAMILAALWWAWSGYTWLTSTSDPAEGEAWAAIVAAMAAMFVAALAVPTAFGPHGVIFGAAFLIVTVMNLTLYKFAAYGDRDLVGALVRVAGSTLVGAALILAAGFAHGAARSAVWVAALAIAYLVPLLIEPRGWRVRPAHFIERHGLFVIIALGESLVAIGLGARHAELDAGEISAAVLGLLVVTAFWLAYFDFFQIRGEQLLLSRTGTERYALARDMFTYLHLPMVAGIVLFAFALKGTLAHVGDELGTVEAVALAGGPALYLFAFVALRVRVARTIGGGRLVATAAFILLVPVATVVPALAALTLVAAVWVGLHAYELIRWREEREETRALRLSHDAAP
jgi:low temperature requirement protein LtrA